MYAGKTLFAQIMDVLPWTTFQRIVDRYGGNHRTRTLSCAEQFRMMAFAQLSYRESLRDIETCLSAQAAKPYRAARWRSNRGQSSSSWKWRASSSLGRACWVASYFAGPPAFCLGFIPRQI